jgi:glycosyltransferase involved in cell wall biosynthesis
MSRRPSSQWASAARAAAEAPSVDVLIPTCNRPTELAVTLAGLAAQSEPSFRVIISDQSTDQPAWEHPAVAAVIRLLEAQGRTTKLAHHLPRRGMAEQRQFLLDMSNAEQSAAEKVLFLDDDIWLEPGALQLMSEGLDQLGCGLVGMAPQGLSFLGDKRPEQLKSFEAWDGPVIPERIRAGSEAFERWPLHSAANLSHLSAELELEPGQWIPYKVAWIGGCAMFRRHALNDTGGFTFWDQLPRKHCGEDVLAQWLVMEKYGGAGILPSGAVHLESPTTVPDRRVQAYDVVLGRTGDVDRTGNVNQGQSDVDQGKTQT